MKPRDIAGLLLLALAAGGNGSVPRRHWRAIVVVGLCNSAQPFVLLVHAALWSRAPGSA